MAAPDLKQVVTVTELDDLLQCPVCYEIPRGHIYQCNQGHHVCGDCKSRIDLCPVCRSMFFGTRNYAMEELISNITKLKISKFLPQGDCVEEVTNEGTSRSTDSSDTNPRLTDTDRTETTNESARVAAAMCSGLFRCLCCRNGSTNRLPVARMLNHLRYWHSLDLIEGNLENDQYEQAWQIPMYDGRIVLAVRVAQMGIFFLVIEIKTASIVYDDTAMDIHAWLSMVASPVEAENFQYKLTMTGSDREATFSDSVMSVRSCEGQLKKRRRCLILNDENTRAFLEGADSQVTVRLCVARASGPRDDLRAEPRVALRIANRSLSDAGSTHSVSSLDRPERNTANNNHVTERAPALLSQAELARAAIGHRLSRNARRNARRRANAVLAGSTPHAITSARASTVQPAARPVAPPVAPPPVAPPVALPPVAPPVAPAVNNAPRHDRNGQPAARSRRRRARR